MFFIFSVKYSNMTLASQESKLSSNLPKKRFLTKYHSVLIILYNEAFHIIYTYNLCYYNRHFYTIIVLHLIYNYSV